MSCGLFIDSFYQWLIALEPPASTSGSVILPVSFCIRGFFFVECVSAIAIHSISLSKSINLRNSNSRNMYIVVVCRLLMKCDIFVIFSRFRGPLDA